MPASVAREFARVLFSCDGFPRRSNYACMSELSSKLGRKGTRFAGGVNFFFGKQLYVDRLPERQFGYEGGLRNIN